MTHELKSSISSLLTVLVILNSFAILCSAATVVIVVTATPLPSWQEEHISPYDVIYLIENNTYALWMSLWYLAPVVADVTLGIPLPAMPSSPMFSEAAACWETLHRPKSRTSWMSPSICVMLREGGSGCFIVMPPHTHHHHHRTSAAAPKTKNIGQSTALQN